MFYSVMCESTHEDAFDSTRRPENTACEVLELGITALGVHHDGIPLGTKEAVATCHGHRARRWEVGRRWKLRSVGGRLIAGIARRCHIKPMLIATQHQPHKGQRVQGPTGPMQVGNHEGIQVVRR